MALETQVWAPWLHILTTTVPDGGEYSLPLGGSAPSGRANSLNYGYGFLLGVVWGGGSSEGGAEKARVKGCGGEGAEERGVVWSWRTPCQR